MAKAESSNRRRAVEILPPESGPLPIDITESMVREGVAFLEHHRESLDGESLVARLFETMMAAAPIEQTLTLEQVLRQLHESEIKAGFTITVHREEWRTPAAGERRRAVERPCRRSSLCDRSHRRRHRSGRAPNGC